MFEKQSIGGAAKQENQQVACTSGEIALDVESLPVQMAVRKPSNPALPLVVCSGDGKSGAYTTLKTGIEGRIMCVIENNRLLAIL